MTKTFDTKKFAVCSLSMLFFLGAGLHTNIIRLPITNVTSSMWSEDLGSYEGTVKAADNVFVGKVIKKTGARARYETPETQFEVEVIRNVKGNLQGTAIVSQEGGYKDGILYRSSDDITATGDKPVKEKDDGLMKEGETYLFVIMYSEMGKWQCILHHSYGTKLLSNNKNLDKAALQSLYENDERFIKLKEAYEKGLVQATEAKDGTKNTEKSPEQVNQNIGE